MQLGSRHLACALQLKPYLFYCWVTLLFGQNEARQHTILLRISHPRIPHCLPADAIISLLQITASNKGLAQGHSACSCGAFWLQTSVREWRWSSALRQKGTGAAYQSRGAAARHPAPPARWHSPPAETPAGAIPNGMNGGWADCGLAASAPAVVQCTMDRRSRCNGGAASRNRRAQRKWYQQLAA